MKKMRINPKYAVIPAFAGWVDEDTLLRWEDCPGCLGGCVSPHQIQVMWKRLPKKGKNGDPNRFGRIGEY